ncbi:hypothetical protein AAG570_008870, partial [Ranatra chinensis]
HFLDIQDLNSCLSSLHYEQKELCRFVSGSALSSCRLRQRIMVVHRYFVALGRYRPAESSKTIDKKLIQKPVSINKKRIIFSGNKENASVGLARVGTRAALNFSFAFLRRAWRSGEDADLCTEMLQESLEALRSLQEATLFDEGGVSPVWMEVVERSTKFLRHVVLGDENSSSSVQDIPLSDQHYALCLLLELAVQRATLSHLLEAVLLLLLIWTKRKDHKDNRIDVAVTNPPLIPLLKRLKSVEPLKASPNHEQWTDTQPMRVSATECFLRFLQLPEDDSESVDLQLAAIVMMAHLDRLATPHLPPPTFLENTKLYQDVRAWGWVPWNLQEGPQTCEQLGEIGVSKMSFSEKSILLLTNNHQLYNLTYNHGSLVSMN